MKDIRSPMRLFIATLSCSPFGELPAISSMQTTCSVRHANGRVADALVFHILFDMKVVLPDRSELELPDGANGLDAARAIGPKLAEQAVLVRTNGRVQDLRLPLEDGQPIQILTTRGTSDPDALAVLRHSSAHLLAEAVRRL